MNYLNENKRPSRPVIEEINFECPAILLHLQAAKQETINKIQGIVREVLGNNKNSLNLKSSPEETLALMKDLSTKFMERELSEEKMIHLSALSAKTKEIVSKVATFAGVELMQSPMRGFFSMLSASTSEAQLTNFILIQSIAPAEKLEKVIDLFQNSLSSTQ